MFLFLFNPFQLLCFVLSACPHQSCAEAWDKDNMALQYDQKNQLFSLPGDVSLAAILPITCDTQHCNNASRVRVDLKSMLLFLEPLLYVLRKRNFSLTAEVRNGTEKRRLNLGLLVLDQERVGGVTGSVEHIFRAIESSKGLYTKSSQCNRKRVRKPDGYTFRDESSTMEAKRIMGVVGPWMADEKVHTIAPIASSYRLVVIATASTRDEFSCVVANGEACSYDYRYLFRAGSSDRYQAFAMVDLLNHFNWTHFGIVADSDPTNTVLVPPFLKRVQQHRLCPAFVAELDTEADARRVFALLRKHPLAKVVVVFANTTGVRLLMETLAKNAASLKQAIPRIWLGPDRWGSAIELPFETSSDYDHSQTMRAVLGFGGRVPSQFAKWSGSSSTQYADEFSQYILNITAGKLRRNRSLTGNPLLCLVMEVFNNCSGVCEIDALAVSHGMPRCKDKQTLPRTVPGGTVSLPELVEPFTMLAAEILLQSLQILFQKTAARSPNLKGEALAQKFFDDAYGEKLWDAVKSARLPCKNGRRCLVFPGKLQELLPEYNIAAASMRTRNVSWAGHWRATDDAASTSKTQIKIRKEGITFGRDLFVEAEHRTTYVTASHAVPQSSCTPACKTGFEAVKPRDLRPTCCHICKRCPRQQYSSGGIRANCRPCRKGEAPCGNQSACCSLPRYSFAKSVKIAFTIVLLLFAVLVVATFCVLMRFRTTAIVRSSDLALSVCLLAAMLVGCSGAGVRLANSRPSRLVCTIYRALSCGALLLSSSAQLVKTARMARIYFMSSNLWSGRGRRTMKTSAQILYVLVLVVNGAIADTLMIFAILRSPQPQEEFTPRVTYEVCAIAKTASLVVDSYVLVLILITVVVAFCTRKLPLNFNETRFLFLGAFSQVVVWAALRPAYYYSPTAYSTQLADISLLVIHLLLLWLWLFAPRLYILLLRPHKRNKRRSTGNISSALDHIDAALLARSMSHPRPSTTS